MLFFIAQIIGFLGIGVNAMIYRQKNRKNLLTMKLISDIIWGIHYALIGAGNGAVTCGISSFREIVFLSEKQNSKKSKLWLLFFVICNVISIILTWKGIISVLPAIASIVSIFMFWVGNPQLTRKCQIPISAIFLMYNIYSSSYIGILNEIFSLTSIFIFTFMHHWHPTAAEKKSR